MFIMSVLEPIGSDTFCCNIQTTGWEMEKSGFSYRWGRFFLLHRVHHVYAHIAVDTAVLPHE